MWPLKTVTRGHGGSEPLPSTEGSGGEAYQPSTEGSGGEAGQPSTEGSGGEKVEEKTLPWPWAEKLLVWFW